MAFGGNELSHVLCQYVHFEHRDQKASLLAFSLVVAVIGTQTQGLAQAGQVFYPLSHILGTEPGQDEAVYAVTGVFSHVIELYQAAGLTLREKAYSGTASKAICNASPVPFVC